MEQRVPLPAVASPPQRPDCGAHSSCSGGLGCNDGGQEGAANKACARRASSLLRLPTATQLKSLLELPDSDFPTAVSPVGLLPTGSPLSQWPSGHQPSSCRRGTRTDTSESGTAEASNGRHCQCPTGLGTLKGQDLAPPGLRKGISMPTTGSQQGHRPDKHHLHKSAALG